MGNKHGNAGKLQSEGKLCATKFDEDELHILKRTWEDLANRSEGRGINKETFHQYMPLNGLLGDRLFVMFDKKNSGYIDFDEVRNAVSLIIEFFF